MTTLGVGVTLGSSGFTPSGRTESPPDPTPDVPQNPGTNSDSSITSNNQETNTKTQKNDSSTEVEIISITPNPAETNQIVTFVGTVNNLENAVARLSWDFGDSSYNVLGESVTHAYSDAGTYTVTLSTTIDGETYQDSEQIIVNGPASLVDAGGPYFGKINDLILFEASVTQSGSIFSSNTQINNIKSYSWDFGDGSSKITDKPTIFHMYGDAGIYTVTLTVTDNDDNTYSDTATAYIAKIIITIHPSNPVLYEDVTFGVEVLGFSPTSYEWHFSDGDKADGQSVTHMYSEAGTYYGKLYVSGGHVSNIMADYIVTVSSQGMGQSNIKPVSRFTVSPNNADTSTVFEFDASQSYDQDGNILSYEWYFGDGSVILTRNKKCYYTYDRAGDYNVICIAGDDEGKYSSSSKIINVAGNNNGDPPQGASQLSVDSTKISSLKTQNEGLLFYSGEMNEVEEEYSTTNTQTVEVSEDCDLDISVDNNIESIKNGEPVTFTLSIENQLGDYDVADILIELYSDIPGYESGDYFAKYNSDLNGYELNLDISWPEDTKSYTVTLTAKPLGDYSDVDWSGNRWSETISVEFDELSDDIIKSISSYCPLWRVLSLLYSSGISAM